MSGSALQWSTAAAWRADAGSPEPLPHDFVVDGRCPLCADAIRVETTGRKICFREGLECPRCRTNARHRAAVVTLLEELHGREDARVYATEQATPFYVALKRRLSNLSGSEYVRDLRRRLRLTGWLWWHGVRECLHFADLTALKRRDASLDAIVSLDVLEHVSEHRLALRECARVLRPGGTLVRTVPFQESMLQSRRLARVRGDGTIEHLIPEPEYHGDPVSGGVLCFHHFGWDLLDDMREAGFAEACARRVHAPGAAIPQPLWVLVATR